MQVKFTYNLSATAQREALKLGVSAATPQTITIDDPQCILIDHIGVDRTGQAVLDISERRPSRLDHTTEYFDHNVSHWIYQDADLQFAGEALKFGIIETAEQALDAAVYYRTGKIAELIADRERLQAEADADFEARKAEYIANVVASLDKEITRCEQSHINYIYRMPVIRAEMEPYIPADLMERFKALVIEEQRRLDLKAVRDAEEEAKPKVIGVKRVALTDGTGQWFDANRAQHYAESTTWDGNNHISDATGSQWNHEALYRTASCRFILNSWSQYQGARETYEEIPAHEAAAWLSTNGHDADRCCTAEFAQLEIN